MLGAPRLYARVVQPFKSAWKWPQKESVPMLQSFGGTQTPDGIFGLHGNRGVHMPFVGALPLADMAAMAGSAMGPAIRQLHVTAEDFEATWEGVPAALPFRSVPGFLALLKSVQQLSIKGLEGIQLLVRAEAISALSGLQELALGCVTLEGDLTGPCLTQIVCSSLQAQLLTVLARPLWSLTGSRQWCLKLPLALKYPAAPQWCARALKRLVGWSRIGPAGSTVGTPVGAFADWSEQCPAECRWGKLLEK